MSEVTPEAPRVGQMVTYIRSDGTEHEGCIASGGTDPERVQTILYNHPERPGAYKYVHNVQRESAAVKVRCWRPRQSTPGEV